MTVTSILENTSRQGLPVEHGLSLYVQTDSGHRILFDMGQTDLFAPNAEALGLSLSAIDWAVISHGHYDHGGGLATFLSLNHRANVYVHRDAFQPHYSLHSFGLKYIGLNAQLQADPRLVFCHDVTRIHEGLTLFSGVGTHYCSPHGNKLLFGPDRGVNDDFCHEQNLVVECGERLVLFAGCAHSGILNILRRAEEVMGRQPTHVFAGMHLVHSGLSEADEDAYIQTLAQALLQYRGTMFYTMHCTGEVQYRKLKALMGHRIDYLSCGDSVDI